MSFILDCWTSPSQVSYQGIIARWIDRDWTLREYVLDLDILIGHHTGLNLSTSFVKVLNDYKIMNRIIGVTTDNASNCDKFFVELKLLLEQENIVFSENKNRVRCMAHIINLACQDALACLKMLSLDDDLSNLSESESDSENESSSDTTTTESGTSIYFRVSNLSKLHKLHNCSIYYLVY